MTYPLRCMFIAPSDPSLEVWYGGDHYAAAFAEFQRVIREVAAEFGRQTGMTFEPVFHLALRPETHAQISGHQRDDSLLARGFPIPYPQGADGNALISIFIDEVGRAWPELPTPLRSEVAGKDFRRWHIWYAYGGGIAAGGHTIMHYQANPYVEYFYEPQYVSQDDPSPWRRRMWQDAPDPSRLIKSFYNEAWFDPVDGHGYLDVGGGRKARMLHIGDAADEAALIPHWNQGTSWFGSKGLAPVLRGHPDPGFPGDMTDGVGPSQHEIWHMFGDSHVSPFRDRYGWVIRLLHVMTPYDGELQMITMRNGEVLQKRVATLRVTSTEVGPGSAAFAPWTRLHMYGEGFDVIAVRPGELDVIRGQDGVFHDLQGVPCGAWHYEGQDLVYPYTGGLWSIFQIEQVRHDGAAWLRPVQVEPPTSPPLPPIPPSLVSVEIAKTQDVMLLNTKGQQLLLIAILSDGGRTPVLAEQWRSSNRAVTVDASGWAKPRKPGSAVVSAWYRGHEAMTTIQVRRR